MNTRPETQSNTVCTRSTQSCNLLVISRFYPLPKGNDRLDFSNSRSKWRQQSPYNTTLTPWLTPWVCAFFLEGIVANSL